MALPRLSCAGVFFVDDYIGRAGHQHEPPACPQVIGNSEANNQIHSAVANRHWCARPLDAYCVIRLAVAGDIPEAELPPHAVFR